MPRWWIGTSGWHYRHWAGRFYPRGMPTRDWLAYYAERFPTVEINNSFYRQPTDHAWKFWRETAPEGFCYAVKASRYLTHLKRLDGPEGPLRRFIEGAEKLEEHLGPLLYQLPGNFHRTEQNIERLRHLLAILPKNHRHAIEFRHDSWFVEETFRELESGGAALCVFDLPGSKCPLRSTADFAYVRFHGTGPRYSGNYTGALLEDWASRLRDLGRGLEDVYVYFNNDVDGHAVDNAARLAELLG
jgi:uncharacterized protein YecE (DUF72 family)